MIEATAVPKFTGFPKIPRLNRGMVITEKIDGTNGVIHVAENGRVTAGSRTRWITPEQDNYGFATWVASHAIELAHYLGPGTHFGEWWGAGIQRRYGMTEKVFSLFNTGRWNDDNKPPCCRVVPVLHEGPFSLRVIDVYLEELRINGSVAAPGFMDPEGVIVYHEAARQQFKVTIHGDESPKTKAA